MKKIQQKQSFLHQLNKSLNSYSVLSIKLLRTTYKFCTYGFSLFSYMLFYSLKIFIYVYNCVFAQQAFNRLDKGLFYSYISEKDFWSVENMIISFIIFNVDVQTDWVLYISCWSHNFKLLVDDGNSICL